MACSKYELGYEENRFEIVVSQRFHCPICFLVLKDPVMCKNEHYYCSFCIKKHLENSSFCPTCLEPLTVDTLKPSSRIVKDYISELNIHCDFHPRGCPEMVQVGHLQRHVASCGFSPVECSNEGCNVLLNARDKLNHEAEVCDFRKLKCHDCGQLQNEMKDEMMRGQNEVEKIEEKMKGMKVMIDQVLACQDQMQNKIVNEIKQEIKDQIKNEMKNEVADLKVEIKNEMKNMVINAVRDAMGNIDARENIVLVGGISANYSGNKSTECFNWADQTWTLLDSAVFEGRSYSSSFLYQGQMVIAGGRDDDGNMTNTMKCLNVADPSATWKDFAVNLPVVCTGHKVVKHNDQLFLSGGWVEVSDMGLPRCSDAVYEVQLVPTYSSKILTRLPEPRSYHAMEMFDQKLFIFGGHDGRKITASVVQYDLMKNECKEMPPLPYAVTEMATVLWRNNVLVIGGCDEQNKCLKKVVMYDVITGRSQMFQCMKNKRYGCTAVLTDSVVVVMGGWNAENKYLESVESFDLERRVWQDLPDMLEQRAFATAVVKPNH